MSLRPPFFVPGAGFPSHLGLPNNPPMQRPIQLVPRRGRQVFFYRLVAVSKSPSGVISNSAQKESLRTDDEATKTTPPSLPALQTAFLPFSPLAAPVSDTGSTLRSYPVYPSAPSSAPLSAGSVFRISRNFSRSRKSPLLKFLYPTASFFAICFFEIAHLRIFLVRSVETFHTTTHSLPGLHLLSNPSAAGLFTPFNFFSSSQG